MIALPDVSGVPHPATWPLYPHRWLGRFVTRRRFSFVEHGTEHVPAEGPVIIAANHTGVATGSLLGLLGPRPAHVLIDQEMFRGSRGAFLRRMGQIPLDRSGVDPGALKSCLRVLADGHVVGVLPEGAAGAGEVSRFHRWAAYLALVSGAPVVPVTILGTGDADNLALPPRGGPVDIVYGARYRTAQQPWPRTRRIVEVTSLDLRVHMLVALDTARTLTGRRPPGPLPPGPDTGRVDPDPPTSVTRHPGGTP